MAKHPLEPLNADEFRQTATVLRRDGYVSDSFRFASIELKEPLKEQVKAGFSISLTELAAASHREQKKPSVLEKLRERTPEQSKNKTAPKRSAEREL